MSATFSDLTRDFITAIMPSLVINLVNTNNRIVDNAVMIFITGIVALLFKSKYWFSEFKSWLCKRPDGFLTEELPTIDMKSSQRVAFYLTLNHLPTITNRKMVLWLQAKIKVANHVPKIELLNDIEWSLDFTSNRSIAYPFYSYQNQLVYWETLGHGLRFSSNNPDGVHHVLNLMRAEGLEIPNQSSEPETETIIGKSRHSYQASTIPQVGFGRLGSVNPNRSFNQLFFHHKKRILNIIDRFKQQRLYPRHIAGDNKLGFLLHGPPGTGKSSFVVALANYLNRDIVTISRLDTKTMTAEDVRFLIKKRMLEAVIVIDEMDCSGDLFLDRTLTKSATPHHQLANQELEHLTTLYQSCNDIDERKTLLGRMDKLKEDQRTRPDIGFMLQLLDGVEDMDGLVIVGCTNHPELIDPAFKRPGRFGIEVEMKKCDFELFKEICQYYLELDTSQLELLDKKLAPHFRDGIIAPVNLIQQIQMLHLQESGDGDGDGLMSHHLDAIIQWAIDYVPAPLSASEEIF